VTQAGEPLEALVLDLLVWLAEAPRGYAETMDAWRTSCPRLPVWEEANARGYVERLPARIRPSPAGFAQLAASGRNSPGAALTEKESRR